MNHQIDTVEWPSFDQRRHSWMSSGSPFFALTLPSLPRPQTGASSTRPQGVDNFIGFQNAFLSMNHQRPAVEWSAFNQQRHAQNGHSLLHADPTKLDASDAKRVDDPLAVESVIWWVSEIICSCLQPTINLARMDTMK
jgi:hypothetical protein